MSGLPRNFMQRYSEMVEPTIYRLHSKSVALTESPIEAIFATATVSLLRAHGQNVIICGPGQELRPASSRSFWVVEMQKTVGSYRADFMVSLHEDDWTKSVIVECDGHDFHERTKEQASRDRRRDRDMQSMGFRILRFTGTDIYRDAYDCAGEVMLALMNLFTQEAES